MKTVDTTTVDNLKIRPAVIVNPRSYYFEPRIKRTGSEADEMTRIYEKLVKQMSEFKKEIREDVKAAKDISNTLEGIRQQVETNRVNIAGLTQRVGVLETSNTSLNSLVQDATKNANQALSKANAMTGTIEHLTELAEQNAKDIDILTERIGTATAAEINAICV